MQLRLCFEYSSTVIYIPDGYVDSTEQLQEDFLDWVTHQPACWVNGPGHTLALGYGEDEFLTFVNNVVLSDSKEKAYFLSDARKPNKVKAVLNF